MAYSDEQIDDFLKTMNVELLSWQKELFKKLVNEPEKKIYAVIPPRLGRGYFLEHLPKLMEAIKGEKNGL